MKQKFARKKINTLDYLYKTETWDNFFNVCLTSLKEKSLEELINLKRNFKKVSYCGKKFYNLIVKK